MDNNPSADQKPISDDQELAKALAGVLPGTPVPAPEPTATTPAPAPAEPVSVLPQPAPEQVSTLPQPTSSPLPQPTPAPATEQAAPAPENNTAAAPMASPELESIKKNALGDLRPLIGKVDLPPEEKFDTYLLLIRSTDDQDLIAPAYEAAQAIADEKRKAEALLDIIKEIDYLSRIQK